MIRYDPVDTVVKPISFNESSRPLSRRAFIDPGLGISNNRHMNKILLVYEDYAELMSVEATLKKVGFDVVGLSSEYSVTEQVLAFNPDLIVGSGKGGKVSSLGVGKRVKEMVRWQGKVILVFPANFKPTPQELIRIRVDMVLEAPVAPLRLMQVIGRILGHDEATLLERLNKSMHMESPQKTTVGGGGVKFNTEGEAIYIKGTVNESSSDTELSPERIDQDSEDSSVSSENQKEKFSFKFGDRVSSADREQSSKSEDQGFPDVDLKALERELLGGGAPEVERIETAVPEEDLSFVRGGADDSVDEGLQARAKQQLEASEKGMADRVAKYSSIVGDLQVSSRSTITRVEARRRQKQLKEDLGDQNLNDLDELRREFTKALFKK